jgi:hypothetical protein
MIVEVVMVVKAQALHPGNEMAEWSTTCLPASIFKSHRNNEMIEWFAKYFL